ncbi:hypothetical protein OESDEN_02932 [Oesophagostomum dentatum]|uniref:Uncharacterized protein n=1 Tax=Oesophagostomum dentatum TaxID=61180 RepID=A0A0B1TNY2_OESDE|nr:hypothetical protein OESDEN_02932 [Oesophagostomum dentatum]
MLSMEKLSSHLRISKTGQIFCRPSSLSWYNTCSDSRNWFHMRFFETILHVTTWLTFIIFWWNSKNTSQCIKQRMLTTFFHYNICLFLFDHEECFCMSLLTSCSSGLFYMR